MMEKKKINVFVVDSMPEMRIMLRHYIDAFNASEASEFRINRVGEATTSGSAIEKISALQAGKDAVQLIILDYCLMLKKGDGMLVADAFPELAYILMTDSVTAERELPAYKARYHYIVHLSPMWAESQPPFIEEIRKYYHLL